MSTGIVIVKEWESMVVLKFGRHVGTRTRGMHLLVPFVFSGYIVDLREQVERVPTQKYITRDNVVIDMDFVLYYRVLSEQAEKSVIGGDGPPRGSPEPGGGGPEVDRWHDHPG